MTKPIPQDNTELIERLRRQIQHAQAYPNSPLTLGSLTHALTEAADALESLKASREVIELREALNKAHRAFKGIEREASEGAAYGKKHGAEWWDSSLGVIASSARRNERRLRNLLPSRPDEGGGDE